jgi:hypothetical protein
MTMKTCEIKERFGIDAAREFDVPLRIGHLVEEEHVEAMAHGWGERDATVPFALQEECAGVKMRKAKA